ncbi:hypothetical protein Tco_1449141 [Tanacetum coccineum]
MCTYLKNMEGYKLKDLKSKGFYYIQKMFDRAFKRVNTFKDFRTELVEGKGKRVGIELMQENAKKQKMEDDKETIELKQCLEIILDEEEGAGLRLNAKVNDIIRHGSWCWPNEWALKYPSSNNVTASYSNSYLIDVDRLKWRNLDAMDSKFSVAKIWEHLKQFTGILNIPSDLNSIVNFHIPSAKMRSARNVIVKLIFAASCYFLWQECNDRLFMKKNRFQDQVIDVIKSNIRLKLLTCRFKKTAHVQTLFHRWKLPNSLMGPSRD